jgi:hypothetical protein
LSAYATKMGRSLVPAEVADMFELPVEQVRRILLFAYQSELELLTEAHWKRPNLPRAYYHRAGLLVKNVAEIARALRPPPTRKGGTTMTATANPETIYIEPRCDRCKHYADERSAWWDAEEDAGCVEEDDCAVKPVAYIRADLFRARLQEMEDNAVDFNEARELHIAILTALLIRARDRLDAFGDADLMEEINSALGRDKEA